MNKKTRSVTSLVGIFKEFFTDAIKNTEYEIVDIFKCPQTGCVKAEILLSGRHIIEKNISDLVTDMSFLECFDKKTIRTLTYLATVERLDPDYSIVVQRLGSEADDFILEIRSRNNKNVITKSPIEVTKDKKLISKFSPVDANHIGYLAGIQASEQEIKLKKNNK